MADAEEDNIFEDEQKIIDYAEQELSDSGSDNEDDNGAASQAKREKKEKKKRKFDEMKEKKLSALSKPAEPPAEIVSAESQLELYLRHKEPNIPMDFTENNFLMLPPPATDAEECNRFIRTIDLMFSSRADMLRLPATQEEGCCSPAVVVICSGARRGCDVINTLSQNLKCKIGKLFAKHFRIQDQIEILKSTHFPVVVGTPNRLHKLVEMGALSLTHTVLVVVDLCEDVKGFNVMSLSDTKNDFYSFMSSYCSQEKDHVKIACIKEYALSKTTTNTTQKGQTFNNKSNKKFKSQSNNKNRQSFQRKN